VLSAEIVLARFASLLCLLPIFSLGCGEPSSEASPAEGGTAAAVRQETAAAELRPPLSIAAEALAREPDPTLDASGDLPAPPGAGEVPARALEYLELGHRQLDRLERGIGEMGASRDASAGLAAAALAAQGRGEAGEAARHVREALEGCAGRWHAGGCERGTLPLQRLVLQFPGVLPEELAARVRGEMAAPVPPPADPGEPWAFQPTENQRLLTTARALGAHAVGGSADSPGAKAWVRHAEALLAARDAAGWYEEESAGYLGLSVESLVHLHDFAPSPRVRRLAGRQLHLLFARWAERQVGGVPAGARTRTYVQWAVGDRNVPWPAWAWYFAGVGDPSEVRVGDWPELALSGYRLPEPLVRLLRERPSFGSYEVRQRRAIDPGKRKAVDAAVYTWATPDYVLSASMAVDGLSLAVSGGQEVPVVLLPEGSGFAPLYLWSRSGAPREERWRVRADQELAAAHRDVALARLGTAEEPGHAYLAPGWTEVAVTGETVVARRGDTFVALTADGGWEVAPAQRRFPAYYGKDPALSEARVAVPKRQPAAVALEVGRADSDGAWAAWRERAAGRQLAVERSEGGEPTLLSYRAGDGHRLAYRPGRSLSVDGEPVDARSWPRHASPFLAGDGAAWRFALDGFEHRFAPLAENRRPSEERLRAVEPPPAPAPPQGGGSG
jgi:hypothetical protein